MPAFASYPAPRTAPRMAYDAKHGVSVLFGGRGVPDAATGLTHGSDETWIWNGAQWLQKFPATRPSPRSSHAMVYDSARERVVLFGGRVEATERAGRPSYLNDTWVWENETWTRIETAQAPTPRHVVGIAYDSDRDRVVLYGGNGYAADGKTVEAFYDMWEFDGTNWTQVGGTLPQVAKPILGYDPIRDELLLLGVTEGELTRVMHRYVAATNTWSAVTPTNLPTCINEGHLVFQDRTNTLRFVGGLCPTGTPELEEVFDWNGTNWIKKTMLNAATRGVGQASAYDAVRDQIVLYGGSSFFGDTVSARTSLIELDRYVIPGTAPVRPSPRTLAAVATDTVNNTVWLFGGLDDSRTFYYDDFWGYRNGQWFRPVVGDNAPGSACSAALGAFDSDRGRFIVHCSSGVTHEWNGTTWAKFDPSKKPDVRQFASLAYDARLKKTVLFGGYTTANGNYRNDTWTWNGTTWTEVDIDNDDRPERRGLMTMWYDPLEQKTILYGGFGRQSIDESVMRFGDMWAFDGTKWAKIDVQTPGQRFGPQVAVNPTTGKVLLLGGLRSEPLDEDSITQFFDNDTWEWDGATRKWTLLSPQRSPDVRQNGMLAWDPLANEMVLFSGHANGFYRSDVWTWNGLTWEPQLENPARRRATRRGGN